MRSLRVQNVRLGFRAQTPQWSCLPVACGGAKGTASSPALGDFWPLVSLLRATTGQLTMLWRLQLGCPSGLPCSPMTRVLPLTRPVSLEAAQALGLPCSGSAVSHPSRTFPPLSPRSQPAVSHQPGSRGTS